MKSNFNPIKAKRVGCQYNQQQAADHIGKNRKYYSECENGKNGKSFTVAQLKQLAELFGCTVEELI